MNEESKFNRRSSENAMAENAASLKGNIDRYYEWNLRVFPLEKHRRILDLGCGPGIYFDTIMTYSPARYVGADYSPDYLEKLRAMMAENPNCETLLLDLLDPGAWRRFTGERFDDIFCFDVIEHLKDDRAALENIHKIMKTTGAKRLFLKVPALQSIYGTNDRAIGHYRRYSRRTMIALLGQMPFRIESIGYHNFPGILSWFLVGRILKRQLAVSKEEGRFFNLAVPVIETVERFLPPPVGLSLSVVCSLGE